MKVLLLLVQLFILNSYAYAVLMEGKFEFNSFNEAKEGESQLKFIVESTKVGMFSSDIDGYVKKFSYSTNYDKESKTLENMKLEFSPSEMDTDNDDRNEKLQKYCLDHEKFPKIKINIIGKLDLKNKNNQELKGVVILRGQKKNFDITFINNSTENKLRLKASTVWGLKEMEIPDPSILVAKLSNEIRIHMKINLDIK